MASTAAGRATLRGIRGDILSILGGPCPHVIPYSHPMFLDDVLECFRIVSLGDTSASWWLRAEDSLKQCFRACSGIGARVAVC
jgi:hypothetical protein